MTFSSFLFPAQVSDLQKPLSVQMPHHHQKRSQSHPQSLQTSVLGDRVGLLVAPATSMQINPASLGKGRWPPLYNLCLEICNFLNIQAWNYAGAIKAMASVAPGLSLGVPSKVPHRHKDLPLEVVGLWGFIYTQIKILAVLDHDDLSLQNLSLNHHHPLKQK